MGTSSQRPSAQEKAKEQNSRRSSVPDESGPPLRAASHEVEGEAEA